MTLSHSFRSSGAKEFKSLQETQMIKKDQAFMREIKQGLAQLEKGQRFSFEEVFGKSASSPKRKK